MSIAQFNALYSAAVTALDAGDYAAAIVAATKAQLLLGTSPNISRTAGQGEQKIGWNDGTSIDRFIANCRRLASSAAAASSGAFSQSKVTYARATDG